MTAHYATEQHHRDRRDPTTPLEPAPSTIPAGATTATTVAFTVKSRHASIEAAEKFNVAADRTVRRRPRPVPRRRGVHPERRPQLGRLDLGRATPSVVEGNTGDRHRVVHDRHRRSRRPTTDHRPLGHRDRHRDRRRRLRRRQRHRARSTPAVTYMPDPGHRSTPTPTHEGAETIPIVLSNSVGAPIARADRDASRSPTTTESTPGSLRSMPRDRSSSRVRPDAIGRAVRAAQRVERCEPGAVSRGGRARRRCGVVGTTRRRPGAPAHRAGTRGPRRGGRRATTGPGRGRSGRP